MKLLITFLFTAFLTLGCYTMLYPPPEYVLEEISEEDLLEGTPYIVEGDNITIYNDVDYYFYDRYYHDNRYWRYNRWGDYYYWDPYYYNYNYNPHRSRWYRDRYYIIDRSSGKMAPREKRPRRREKHRRPHETGDNDMNQGEKDDHGGIHTFDKSALKSKPKRNDEDGYRGVMSLPAMGDKEEVSSATSQQKSENREGKIEVGDVSPYEQSVKLKTAEGKPDNEPAPWKEPTQLNLKEQLEIRPSGKGAEKSDNSGQRIVEKKSILVKDVRIQPKKGDEEGKLQEKKVKQLNEKKIIIIKEKKGAPRKIENNRELRKSDDKDESGKNKNTEKKKKKNEKKRRRQ